MKQDNKKGELMFNHGIKLALGVVVALSFGTGTAFAADCSGAVVTEVLINTGTNCADGSYAFLTDQNTSEWMCVETITGAGYAAQLHNAAEIIELNKLVLAAYLSGRPVHYSIRGRTNCLASNDYVIGESVETFYLSN